MLALGRCAKETDPSVQSSSHLILGNYPAEYISTVSLYHEESQNGRIQRQG
jgi:hypothetical protein